MSGFDEDDGFASEAAGYEREARESLERRAARSKRALAMFDNVRSTMYLTMAGLLEAGIGIAEAAALLSAEYGNEKMNDAESSVSIFFGEVSTLLANKLSAGDASALIGDAALRAFGVAFVGPEEMALLKALAVSTHPERLLLACARLLDQYDGERSVGTVTSFRRVAG